MENKEKLMMYYNQPVNAFAFLKLLKGQCIRAELHIPVVGTYYYSGLAEDVMDYLDASIAENEYMRILGMSIDDGVPTFRIYGR